MCNRNVPRTINNVVLKDDVMSSKDFEDYSAELLGWVNDKLKTKFTKISDLDGGDAYCKLLEKLFPGHVAMSMVSKSKNPDCRRRNLLVLRKAFLDLNIHSDVPIESLLEHNFQESVLFLKWFTTFYEMNVEADRYDQSSEMECDKKVKKTPKPRSKAAPKGSKAAPKGTKMKKPCGVKDKKKEALVKVIKKNENISPEAKKRLIKNVTCKKGNSKSTKPSKKNQKREQDGI